MEAVPFSSPIPGQGVTVPSAPVGLLLSPGLSPDPPVFSPHIS